MKKLTVIIILYSLLITTLLTGCKADKAFQANQWVADYSKDMQYMYCMRGFNLPMTKSDKGYYYVGDDNIILFVDKQSKKATPLCSKPNCLHDNPNTCNAYININEACHFDAWVGGDNNVIQFYDGYLYTLCGEYDKSFINYSVYLVKMSPDGSNRQQVTDSFKELIYNWFLHRGYLYLFTDKEIKRLPVDSLKSKPETVFKAKYYYESSNTFSNPLAYRDNMYFSYDEADENNNGAGHKEIILNLKTLKSKEIPKVKKQTVQVNSFVNDNLVLTYYDSKKDENVYLKSDLNCKNYDEFFRQPHSDLKYLCFDGEYYYLDNSSNYNLVQNHPEKQLITVCDKSLNEIDSFKLPIIHDYGYLIFNPQDNENFLLVEKEKDVFYLVIADKSQIGSIGGNSIEYTRLCKLKWAKSYSNTPYVKQ